MKNTNKISIALCGVAIVSAFTVGLNTNSKLVESQKIISTLKEEVETNNITVQELEKSTKSLQEELKNANDELAAVKKDIKNIKNIKN